MMVNVIAHTQQKLKDLYGPTHYYTTRYADEEMQYCGRVPTWLEESLLKLDSHDVVLDIGSGYGTLACAVTQVCNAQVLCADRLPFIIEPVKFQFPIITYSLDIEREIHLLPDLKFRVVIMTEVIEHFNFHPSPTLKAIKSRMPVGGRLFLSTPDSESWGRCNIYSQLSEIPAFNPELDSRDSPPWVDGHVWQYSSDEIRQVLGEAGFKILRFMYSQSSGGRHFNIECGA